MDRRADKMSKKSVRGLQAEDKNLEGVLEGGKGLLEALGRPIGDGGRESKWREREWE